VPGFAEHEALIIGLSGPHAPKNWDTPSRTVDFFDLKGLLETLFEALHLRDQIRLLPVDTPTATAAYQLNVVAGTRLLGHAARLSDALTEAYELRAPLYYAELHWEALAEIAHTAARRRYQPFSRFPEVDRDLAILVDQTQPVGPLLEAIREAGAPLLRQAEIFDLYEGERIPAGKKSVAVALRFGTDRTLTDAEVDAQMATILEVLTRRFGAQLRQ
jgi:phenylalanyl-tRNA synthetase beta chain